MRQGKVHIYTSTPVSHQTLVLAAWRRCNVHLHLGRRKVSGTKPLRNGIALLLACPHDILPSDESEHRPGAEYG